jgi:ATP-binding cassette subfamily C exporter for protease/lipase
MNKVDKKRSELRDAFSVTVPWLNRMMLFSLATGVLVLAPSWYMMEVYDRVVNSRSHLTLAMLTLLVVGLYAMLESIEWARSMTMCDAGRELDRRLRDRVFNALFSGRLKNLPAGNSLQTMGDLRTLRDFFPSPVFLAFFDVPLALLVLVILYFMNPALCGFAVAGGVVQFLIGYFNELRVRRPLTDASRRLHGSQLYAFGVLRNVQVIESMGMLSGLRARWLVRQRKYLSSQAEASDTASTNAALSRLVQSLLGSLLLGMGCWLTLKGELFGSGMIVASILGGRVLSPMVQIIASWRQIDGAREAIGRLDGLLKAVPAEQPSMPLHAPKGVLTVENLQAGALGSQVQILKGLSFRVASGDSVAVVGPSASGKTTLARLLVGVWAPMRGNVRLDGCDVMDWNKEELGPHVGYLPQNVELFDGTMAENISRFGLVDREKVHRACIMVGLDDFISSLPAGYDTRIGEDGAFLSGGQRQRIGLARAVYGMPAFVVLDEPDSSLDEAGDRALIETLRALKAAGSTVIVMTHRLDVLAAIDYLLVLIDGQVRQLGPRDQVLESMKGKPAQPVPALPGGARP